MAILDTQTAMKRGKIRGRESRNQTLTTKVTATEYRAVEDAASAEAKTTGEWLRDLALEAIAAQAEGGTETVVLPEIVGVGAIFLAMFLTAVSLYGRLRFIGTPLQRFYMPVYVRSSIFGSFSRTHRSDYRMLFLTGHGRKPSPAMSDDVVRGKTVEPGGRIIPLALSPAALQRGEDLLFRGPVRSYVDARLCDYLKVAVYQTDLSAILKLPLLCGVGVFLVLLPFAVTKDVKRQKSLKYGRRLKGPERLTPQEFNRTVRGDGIGFKTDDMKEMIRIPAKAEAQHMQIIGDTGSGKSALLFQVLRQVQGRGDSAIVYDPAREFVKRFYDPSRGDVILNPLDKRCPYWGPAEDLRSRSEAKAFAASLFQPPQDRKGEFFIESPQKIFAFLMAYRPTPDELVQWLSNPDEIDRRLKGTEHAHLIDPRAQQLRAGVLGSLGLVADSLRLLPKREEGNGTWTATEWAEKRKGWIFITSLPAEREALRPLQSLWIDWLVLRLLNEPTKDQKRVWFVIDELASLQKLPQLHTAITEGRKGQNPVLLGFQGKAQLEYLHGHLAEVMLSQPASSVWLTTKEPNAGEWVSKFIGKVEIERLREMHFDGTRSGHNFTIERQVEPLVLESEISGLADLHAFMKYRNYVTFFSFPYFDMPEVAKPFELRERPDDRLPYVPKTLADEFGNQADRVVAEARERRQQQGQERPLNDRQQQVREAITFARDKGFEREAVVDERALYVGALRRGMGEMTYPEVRASFEARVASGEFKQITDDGLKAGRRFTTAATIKAETEIVHKVRVGQNRAPQIMAIESAVPLSESRPHFNAAQKRVVEEVLTSRDRVQGLQGRAGSGKTSVLESIRQGAEQSGYAVEGFAPTSRATRQLRDAGVRADTLQRFLAGGQQAAGNPASKHLYMVDESSLASTQQMRDFLNKIAMQDRVLLIGDTRQHQGVHAGKPFEQLQEAGMRTAQLDQIMRQKDAALLKAVEHPSNNETAIGVEMLSQQGRITEIVDREQRVAAIAKDYAAHPENTLIVSPDDASRRAINQAVRQELQTLGVVDGKDYSMRVLAPRNDMTGADRQWANSYQTGDVLHYTRGSKEHGIEPKSYAHVVAINPK